MFGITDLTGLGFIIALCGLIPVVMAFVEDPSALQGGDARPGGRLVGFLSGHGR